MAPRIGSDRIGSDRIGSDRRDYRNRITRGAVRWASDRSASCGGGSVCFPKIKQKTEQDINIYAYIHSFIHSFMHRLVIRVVRSRFLQNRSTGNHCASSHRVESVLVWNQVAIARRTTTVTTTTTTLLHARATCVPRLAEASPPHRDNDNNELLGTSIGNSRHRLEDNADRSESRALPVDYGRVADDDQWISDAERYGGGAGRALACAWMLRDPSDEQSNSIRSEAMSLQRMHYS